MKINPNQALPFFVLAVVALAGCHTAHDVAVTSFHVIDAPANYVRRHIDEPTTSTTTTTTTTSSQSDVVVPGHPLATPTPSPRRLAADRPRHTESSGSDADNSDSTHVTGKPSPSQRSIVKQTGAKIPVAKAVPGKRGYVYSPFDPSGGYVDVTGYTSGSKVKDPYSGKIFIVP